MVKSNIHIPQQPLSVSDAVNGLLQFMNHQIATNKSLAQNMAALEKFVVLPLFKGMDAGKVTCVSAIV